MNPLNESKSTKSATPKLFQAKPGTRERVAHIMQKKVSGCPGTLTIETSSQAGIKFMKMQIKTHQRSKHSGPAKATQHGNNRRVGGLPTARPHFEPAES